MGCSPVHPVRRTGSNTIIIPAKTNLLVRGQDRKGKNLLRLSIDKLLATEDGDKRNVDIFRRA